MAETQKPRPEVSPSPGRGPTARRPRPLVVLAALLVVAVGLWYGLQGLGYVLENPSSYPGLDSFAAVEEGKLYRSGQLSIEDFADVIKEHGIKTVLCVRGGYRNPLQNAWFRRETDYCEEHGVNFVHAPMKSEESFAGNLEAVKRFWKLVDDPASQPILVHCERGADRTGVLSYLYRIHRQGWSEEEARREMMRLGASKNRVDPILRQVQRMQQQATPQTPE